MRSAIAILTVLLFAEAASAEESRRLLPLTRAGAAIHFWNSSPTETVAVVEIGTSSVEWRAKPFEHVVARLSGFVAVRASDAVKVWTEIEGAVFEAVKPQEVWRAIVEPGTGLAFANGGTHSVEILFALRTGDGRTLTTTARLTERACVAFFASELFPGEDGTLLLVATGPIAIATTQCAERCENRPVGGGDR